MARSDDLAAAVVALIQTASAGDPATIAQGFAPDPKRISLADKRVYVFALSPTTVAQLTRRDELREYKVAIVVVERYDEPATGAEVEPVPETWIKERKSWVVDYIYDTLNPKDVRPLSMWPNRCEIVTDVDFANLQNKIFWSEIEVDYREVVTN